MELASYRCGDFHVDAVNRRFTYRGVEVALEPKTFAVVLQLLARPQALITREELLDTVWGHRYVTPSALNRTIALARRAFGDDSAEPRYIVTVHGAGYRYIGPIEGGERSATDQPARFAPPPVARLPARIDALIGREQELAALRELVDAHRAVTVLGPGGIGKTQCVLEMARRLAPEYPDGVWFFDLIPMKHGEDWLRALAACLAIPAAERRELISRIVPLFQGRRALLVLDNCDRIAADVGALVYELLRGTDQLRVAATSQVPLNLIGEHVMRLPPLRLPIAAAPEEQRAEQVATAPAVEMLLARVTAVQPDFRLTEVNAATIAQICCRLDGIPLALELAAARFALLTPPQVLQRLDQRFQFLQSAAAGRDSRHRNLSLLLDWSFGLLSPEEQLLLKGFSVFVHGWTVEAAIEMAAAFGYGPELAVDLLTGLVNKSLVAVTTGMLPPRYQLLETVREYAFEQLRKADEEQRARRAHLALVVRMCEAAQADMLGGRMRERIEQLIHEHGNINAAIEYAVGPEQQQAAALRIVGSLALYFKARSLQTQAYHWCRLVIGQNGALESVERGRSLLALGLVEFHACTGEAHRALLEAARIARLHKDVWSEGYANGYCAMWLCNSGRPQEALAHAAVLERIAADLADPLLVGLAGLARGWIHLAQGHDAAAVAALRPVRHLSRDLHQRHFINMYIGLALFRLGDHREAAARFLEALRGAVEVGNVRGMAGSIEACGYIAAEHGSWSEATRLLAAARGIRERTEVPLFAFWLAHHEAAHALLRARLGSREYETQTAAGLRMREEDAANDARMRLQCFSQEENNPP